MITIHHHLCIVPLQTLPYLDVNDNDDNDDNNDNDNDNGDDNDNDHLCIVPLQTLPYLDVELLNGHHILLICNLLQGSILARNTNIKS